MNCAYCGQSLGTEKRCQTCGAPATPETTPIARTEKGEPFPYNGYIVWPIRRWEFYYDAREFHFYLGDRLVEIIAFSREYLGALRDQLGEGVDFMPIVWRLFEVAQGQEEAFRIMEQNKRLPACFVITRYEHPMKEVLHGMTYDEVLEKIPELVP